jgi:hypothetical protein
LERPGCWIGDPILDPLVAALDDDDGAWLDVDGSSGAVVAAFLVAAARSPSNCPEQRQQLIETVSSVLDIQKYDVGILSV